jgi:hypothetical protein
MRKEHAVPLSRQALAILKDAYAATRGEGPVFPSSHACGEILAQYPSAECAAYLKNAGYA